MAKLDFIDEIVAGLSYKAPFVKKDADQQLVYCAVLVPGEADKNGEPPLTAEEIADKAHDWLENYQLMDRDHALKETVAVPVESYISPQEMQVTTDDGEVNLPVGTWIIVAHVLDTQTWSDIKNGLLNGLSIFAGNKDAVEQAFAQKSATTSTDNKPVLLKDLGDYTIPVVSVVNDPAVPKAKFFAIKNTVEDKVTDTVDKDSQDENIIVNKSAFDTFIGALKGLFVSKKDNTSNIDKQDTTCKKEVLDMDEKALQELITNAIAPIAQSVTDLAAKVGGLLKPEDNKNTSTTDAPAAKETTAPTDTAAAGTDVQNTDLTKKTPEELIAMIQAMQSDCKTAAKSRQLTDSEEDKFAEKSRKETSKPSRDIYGRKIK